MAQETIKTTISTGETIQTRLATISETQDADWEFSKTFNKAIKAGIPPRQALLKELMEQGVWTQEEENKTVVLRVALDNKQMELEAARKEEPVDSKLIEDIETTVKAAQQELWLHTQKLNSLLAHTAENKAEDAKLYYLTYTVTMDKNGKSLWKNYADFRSDTNSERINTAILQYMLLQSGLAPQQKEEIEKAVKADEPETN